MLTTELHKNEQNKSDVSIPHANVMERESIKSLKDLSHFLAPVSGGAAPPHRLSTEMDGGFVQPQFQNSYSNSYFGNPWCSLLHGARMVATTSLSMMGRERNSLHGTEPHNRR